MTTGLETVYEGVTIATLAEHSNLTPLIYGSAGNLVSAAYEKDGKRAILDGGFTRLYCKWETAGTDRFVVNAASWLVNVDNFELSEVGDDGESPEARLRFPLTEVAMLSVEAGIVASLALVRG